MAINMISPGKGDFGDGGRIEGAGDGEQCLGSGFQAILVEAVELGVGMGNK